MKKFDVIVIGSGPGGYPAAIKAAQNGSSVALVEMGALGGTCLNRGCIPSKTLINYARRFHTIKDSEKYGITVKDAAFDFSKMAKEKDAVVKKIRKGLETLVKGNQITLFEGKAKFISPKEIKVKGEDNETLYGNSIIIASGSEPREIPAFPCDHESVHDSTSLLELKELPKKLIIIGGGVIGCEFASMYQRLGVEVSVIEMLPRLIATEAPDLSEALKKSFEKRGIEVLTEAKVQSVEKEKKGVVAKLEGGKSVKGEMALIAVGRKINSDEIDLNAAGISTDRQGAVTVNERMETSVPGVYAIGDLLGKWWLAHVATHQGIVAASNATGHAMTMHEHAVPSVIFTDPEVSSVGLTPEDAKLKGYKIEVGRFPFAALGKAQAIGSTEGFAQVVIEKNTHALLGAQIIGEEASTLIAQMTLAVNNELTAESVTETIHAHPTLSEVWMEACLMALGTPLHLPPKKG